MSTAITFEDYCEEWLKDVRAGKPSATELGHRFARKMLTQWLDIEDSSDDIVYCDGAGDGGIDIAYLQCSEDRENDGDTWFLIQSKYGSAFQGVNTLIEEGQKVISTLDGIRPKLSSLAKGLLERLLNFRQRASENDHLILVFATEEPLTDAEKHALEDVRAMGRSRLGPIFDTKAVSIATIFESINEISLTRISVPIHTNMVTSGEELAVMPISLLSMYDFLKAYRAMTGDLDQLYEKNVRRFLGSLGKVNRGMHQTLQQEPERFGLYNNGITIVVADIKHNGNKELELIEPYVVNGAQTTRTLWEAFQRKLETGGTGTDPELETWLERVRQGVVITKIVKVGDQGEELLLKITRFTNSQNAVREKDFLALTSDFRMWASQMEEKYNVFLEIQRGGWDSRRALQHQNPSIKQFKEYANAFDLLKVYGAGWLGEVGTAFGRNIAFLPNGTIYRRIVNNEVGEEPFGVDDLYAAYRLQKAADTYGFGRGAAKISRRQTRFLFYMIVLELLKDTVMRANLLTTPRSLTMALVKLFQPGKESVVESLLNEAIEAVDEYLLREADEFVFGEPAFQNTFNNDLNAYLKWEQLGKTDDASPHLRVLLALTKKALSRGVSGQPSPRDLIISAIRDQ